MSSSDNELYGSSDDDMSLSVEEKLRRKCLALEVSFASL